MGESEKIFIGLEGQETAPMITTKERIALRRKQVHADTVGIDCYGFEIHPGDEVVVMKEQTTFDQSKHRYCSLGKKGTARRHVLGDQIVVSFNDTKATDGVSEISLFDYHLKNLRSGRRCVL
ncbi:MAG: hypothetical protein KBD29_04005 [Candidatus Magasanikbacteria bacterium]|nr:hypothetical protein [Candidatus Magasanikbacteria bacterium]